MIVADASLIIAWLLNESVHAASDTELARILDEPIIVPANWPAEVANAVRKAWRTGRLRREDIDRLILRLGTFELQVAPPIPIGQIGPLLSFAIEFELSTYDAGYVRLALETRSTLATVDRQMRAAAARLRLPLLPRP